MLFNAYYHKKLSKTLSTNINGTIGRQIVYEEVSKLHGVDLRGDSITEKPELKRGVMDFSFNPLSADTHRWSANFHVVPAGSSTRLALIPPSDRYLVNHSDYSQAEISVLAFYSQDERLIEAFLSGRDMHRYVASLAFNLEYDKVSSEQRRSAKAIVFGLLYGKSVASLAMDVSGGDVNKAQELMDVFFKAFPKIKDWMKTKYEEIDKHPYVTNAFGAILNVDVTQADKGAKYRNSVNAPIQNFASMTAGTFMYYFTKALESKGIHTAPFGFVHDAYDDIVPVDYLIEYLNLQKEVMQYAVRDSIGIPIILDQEVGPNALYMNHIKVIKAEGDTIRIQLGGDVEGHEDILRRLGTSETYAVQNIEVLDSSEKTHSFEELFTVGKALKHEWGRTIKEQTIELDLVYHSGVHPDVSYLTRK